MRYRDIFARAGRSLRNAKGRTILTSLAIAVGAFTLTLSLAAGEGARQYAAKLISSNIDPQSVFIAKDKNIFGGGATSTGLKEYSPNATQLGGVTFKTLTADDIAFVEKVDGVESVTPMYTVSVQYVTFEGKDKKYTTDVTAYDPSVRSEVAAGKLPPVGTQIKDSGVIVPAAFAEQLGFSPKEMIGKTVTLHVVASASQLSEKEIQNIIAHEGLAALQKKLTPNSRDEKLTVVAVSAKSSTALSASSGL